jgi:recombination associated protein RdgC
MTFKTLFALNVAKVPTIDQINDIGREYPTRECKYQEEKHWGFKPFEGKAGTSEEYVTPLNNGRWLHLQISLFKPMLPAAVVRRHVDARIKELTEERGEAPGSKEKREIKEQVRQSLLPKAFQTESVYQVVFDKNTKQLWLEVTSEALQTDILRLLRRCLGSVSVTPLFDSSNLPSKFAAWVAGTSDLPSGFRVGDSAKAIDPNDPKATITLSHEALMEPDIQTVLETRMLKQLGLESANISAVINDQSFLKSIKLSVDTSDADADRDHMMTLWATEISELLAALSADIGATEMPNNQDSETYDTTSDQL